MKQQNDVRQNNRRVNHKSQSKSMEGNKKLIKAQNSAIFM